jgi:sterol 24-C-methyltransferase
MMLRRTIVDAARTGLATSQVQETLSSYRALHDDGAEDQGEGVQKRNDGYATMVNQYYDLATDFYEYGWGQSFHFAPRYKGESFDNSLLRHEYYLASQLELRPGMKVIDAGCGVGGPARNIARFSGAEVTGINNNAYQVKRADEHTAKAGLTGQCHFVKADFMNTELDGEQFDGAYAIEATCHAPDRRGVFGEIYRLLKPGAIFTGYEWCMTDNYDASSSEHRRIKKVIEEGDGIPNLGPTSEILEALSEVGFEGVEGRDLAGEGDSETPWYLPLTGKELTLRGLPRTSVGRFISHRAVQLMESLKVAPQGSTELSALLNDAADALVASGEMKIFTPMYFFRGRKPLNGNTPSF